MSIHGVSATVCRDAHNRSMFVFIVIQFIVIQFIVIQFIVIQFIVIQFIVIQFIVIQSIVVAHPGEGERQSTLAMATCKPGYREEI
jgi:hypothetical protein